MRKKLVICPNCQLQSKKTVSKWKGNGFNVEIVRPKPFVIGEIDDDRNFKIKRGGENYTIIQGESFEVRCGNCNEPVYRKEVDNNEMSFNGSIGVFGYQLASSSITVGTFGRHMGSQTA